MNTEEELIAWKKAWVSLLHKKFADYNAQGTGNQKHTVILTGDELFYISKLLQDKCIRNTFNEV